MTELHLPVRLARGGDVTLGIRPEHIALCGAAEGHMHARVEIVEHLGAQTFAYVESATPQALLTVCIPAESGVKPGDTVFLRFDLDKLHVFDADGVALS